MISKMSRKFQYNDGYGTKHTQSPISTGTSVIGLAYDKGVIIAADDLASYGSLARFRNVLRVSSVNNKIALGCTGDYADYQYMMKSIEDLINSEYSYEDNHEMSPQALHTWLTRVQYSQRSDFEPLWCKWVIGGLDHQGKFLLKNQLDQFSYRGCVHQANLTWDIRICLAPHTHHQ